jgi:hypothetical protein
MYEVLATTMEIAGRPKAEVERVLLSSVDFTAVDVPSMLFSAAYMTRFGRHERALQLYQQASRLDPLRSEPYILGLKLARQTKNVDAIEWAAAGILTRAWNKDHETLHREAEQAVAEAEALIQQKGDAARLKAFQVTLAAARQRDLILRLEWSGDADLDLVVEEPLGTICSFETPLSRGGGVLAHDGYGPHQKNSYELYICPLGVAGEYRVHVRYVTGNVVAKQATLKIIRYQGTPDEIVRERTVAITPEDQVLKISLHQGRRKELSPPTSAQVPPAGMPVAQVRPTVLQMIAAGDNGEIEHAQANFASSRLRRNAVNQLRQAAVGFQPIVRVIPEGIIMNAAAVVSPDRRYVRLTVSPIFSTITDVFTFSFSGPTPNTQGNTNRN